MRWNGALRLESLNHTCQYAWEAPLCCEVVLKQAPVITVLHGSHSCFFLSSCGLCCCNIVIKTKLSLARLTPCAEVWWQLKLELISSLEWVCVEAVPNACGMCYWVCWMRGLPKGRGRKWAWKRKKTEKRGGWATFEEHCQEVMTQFVTAAIKHKIRAWE